MHIDRACARLVVYTFMVDAVICFRGFVFILCAHILDHCNIEYRIEMKDSVYYILLDIVSLQMVLCASSIVHWAAKCASKGQSMMSCVFEHVHKQLVKYIATINLLIITQGTDDYLKIYTKQMRLQTDRVWFVSVKLN